jgi:hypothetical protein
VEKLREYLAYWAIRAIIWLLQVHLTHDGGYELLTRDWGVEAEGAPPADIYEDEDEIEYQ